MKLLISLLLQCHDRNFCCPSPADTFLSDHPQYENMGALAQGLGSIAEKYGIYIQTCGTNGKEDWLKHQKDRGCQ